MHVALPANSTRASYPHSNLRSAFLPKLGRKPPTLGRQLGHVGSHNPKTNESLCGSGPFESTLEGLTQASSKNEQEEAHSTESDHAGPSQDSLLFMIRDTSTGKSYDIRNESAVTTLTHSLSTFEGRKRSEAWQDWWKDKKDSNALLLQAAIQGDLERVSDLLDVIVHRDLAADPNTRGNDGYTALHYAVREGNLPMARVLVERGTTVDAQTAALRTPLHIACIHGSASLIQLLLNAKASLKLQDCEGNTPLHLLAEFGWDEELALCLCLSQTHDLTLRNKRGQTVLHCAANDLIKKLLATAMTTPHSLVSEATQLDSIHRLHTQPLPMQDVIDYEETPEVIHLHESELLLHELFDCILG